MPLSKQDLEKIRQIVSNETTDLAIAISKALASMEKKLDGNKKTFDRSEK